ncbi:MAG: hypothetical protein C4293_03985 [Nitrospiraceae bacterium]
MVKSFRKSDSLKDGLEQVRQEVNSWPSWMRGQHAKDSVRRNGDFDQISGSKGHNPSSKVDKKN